MGAPIIETSSGYVQDDPAAPRSYAERTFTAGTAAWHNVSFIFELGDEESSDCAQCVLFFEWREPARVVHMAGQVMLSATPVVLGVEHFSVAQHPRARLQNMPLTAPADADASDCPHRQVRLRRWDASGTWPGGVVPSSTDALITLPVNTSVLMGGCSGLGTASAPLGRIVVLVGSSLILDDVPTDVHLAGMVIEAGGTLQAGSEACPTSAPIHLTFYGVPPPAGIADDVSLAKGIVSSGTVALHGKPVRSTWTRLSATAYPGEKIVHLQDAVVNGASGWGVGHELVITTSVARDANDPSGKHLPYTLHQNEVRTIEAVSVDGRAVQLDRPLMYLHYASGEYQAEAGLLTRSLVLRGNTSDEDGYGGHVMIRTGGEGRFSSVELVGMGQRNRLGRYPLHCHLLDPPAALDAPDPLTFRVDDSMRLDLAPLNSSLSSGWSFDAPNAYWASSGEKLTYLLGSGEQRYLATCVQSSPSSRESLPDCAAPREAEFRIPVPTAGAYVLQLSKPPCDVLSRKQLCEAEESVPVNIHASFADGRGVNANWVQDAREYEPVDAMKKKKRIHRIHVYSSPRARPHTRLAGSTTPRLAWGTNRT